MMTLPEFWFGLIAVLWIGYFFLEGFDFGVGMLLHPLSKDDTDRRVIVNTIGPVWDGNEVWLLVAGGATFAAFPEWYATLFSGFYLPLFLILVALIFRGVAFEYRGKIDNPTWRRNWDLAIAFGSWLPAILWGVAFANIVAGVPIDESGTYTGGFFTLLNPFALLGGLTTALLFAMHGANFLALKTDGEIRHRATATANRLGPVVVGLAAVFLLWNQFARGNAVSFVALAVAAVALVWSLAATYTAKEGAAFAGTGLAIVGAVISLFAGLFPDVMPSSTDPAFSLTIENASSTDYTLRVMTVVALVMTPIVLLYQGWTYWVFRKRISRNHMPPVHAPTAGSAS